MDGWPARGARRLHRFERSVAGGCDSGTGVRLACAAYAASVDRRDRNSCALAGGSWRNSEPTETRMLVNKANDREWKATDYPGIERSLFRTNETGGRSSVVRLA